MSDIISKSDCHGQTGMAKDNIKAEMLAQVSP